MMRVLNRVQKVVIRVEEEKTRDERSKIMMLHAPCVCNLYIFNVNRKSFVERRWNEEQIGPIKYPADQTIPVMMEAQLQGIEGWARFWNGGECKKN